MKSFYQFLLELQESPVINDYNTKDFMKTSSDSYREQHINNMNKAKHIGNDSYHYSDDKYHHYFHMKDGKPLEINRVEKKTNTQNYVDSGDGDVTHVIRHMLHHIKKHGELITSKDQTKGSKHLWINLIKLKPKNVAFETVHDKTPIDHLNIDKKEPFLWHSRSEEKIRAYHVNTSKK